MREIFYRILSFAVVALVAVAGVACTQEFDGGVIVVQQSKDRVERVTLSLMAATVQEFDFGTGRSRALDTRKYMNVRNLWILEYDDAGNLIQNSGRKGATLEDLKNSDNIDNLDSYPITLTVPGTAGVEYTLVVLANTGLSEAPATLDALKNSTIVFDEHRLTATKNSDVLPMSGYTKITSSTTVNKDKDEGTSTTLGIFLYRSLARLNVKVASTNDKIRIKSIQVCHVPDSLHHAERLLDKCENGEFQGSLYNNDPIPAAGSTEFHDMSIVNVLSDEDRQSCSASFIIPRNCQGALSPPGKEFDSFDNEYIPPEKENEYTPEKKNQWAAAKFPNATYVEIVTEEEEEKEVDSDGNNIITNWKYRFYPGLDMVYDFNIVPNHDYMLSVRIHDHNSFSTDSRVDKLETIALKSANSYIINPMAKGNEPVYEIPIDRVNAFWRSAAGDPGKVIGEDTEWEVVVIWQDINAMVINFKNDDEKLTNGRLGETRKYYGKGYDDRIRFSLADVVKEGNVVIGLRARSEINPNADANSTGSAADTYTHNHIADTEFLWSWHLWITSYNPDSGDAWAGEGTAKLEVTGGHVFHYTDNSEYPSYHLWSNTYKGKYIMDRNLGALAANREAGYDATCGLFYQFGRKDPFPSPRKIYKITGELKATGSITIAYDQYPSTDTDIVEDLTYEGWNATTRTTSTCVDPLLDRSLYSGQDPNRIGWIYNGLADNLAVGVMNPYIFYWRGQTTNNLGYDANTDKGTDWVEDNPYVRNCWNSLSNNQDSSAEWDMKSLFDPCPPGWKLPRFGIWTMMENGKIVDDVRDHTANAAGGIFLSDYSTNGEHHASGYDFYISYQGRGDTSFYPASGARSSTVGQFNHAGVRGYLWSDMAHKTTETFNEEVGQRLIYGSELTNPVNHNDLFGRSAGQPVRCIQDHMY